jgi:uncharacterized protein (DUF305 family)
MINHYIVMFITMIAAGALSTMSAWADKWSDIRFSLNDAYMILLMNGWMIFFMGLLYGEKVPAAAGALIALLALGAIRMQLFVTQDQYLAGMIPHHSMAVHMSRRLLKKPNTIAPFLQQIITTQEKEIEFMKASSPVLVD